MDQSGKVPDKNILTIEEALEVSFMICFYINVNDPFGVP